ncbi:pyridoxal phosphate-dependent aminotransferase [Cellulophaga baltica]|uniref:pyridoxal phosphate-dependent aminotransferase n=1 Tax=Cellulophaga TaxID=104264 RepID=UPI001C070E4E|nr:MULTISPECIES: pyridoxal phosphate-dependent aminotransferase [Cellulophaga]MBU2994988.1 pyridoxal phosphate-dependent aminotransferase [Cellulophaga baltica]MDO6766383.1 pyridoxal phosphate-dependent aminotransferase [Cellulophaga sp. 1_MG-2023]
MPAISNKGLSMPESPIRKLVPFADNAKQKGINVIHLNIGQPDIKTPQVALDAVKNNDISILSYAKTEGSYNYREKLAHYYLKNNITINADDILVTTGASEALSFVIGSIADQYDEIIIPEPFYANYNSFSTAFGVTVIPIVSKIETGFALPSIIEFEKAITKKTKAILICNPNNPTGYLYSKKEIKQLAHLVKKHDLFLIVDEVYREFIYDGKEHYSVLKESNLEENAIVIDSVSKRYSMCGARIGCVITKNQILRNTILKFMQARLSPPTYALIASEAALDTPQSYFDDVIEEYASRRNILITELNKINEVTVVNPQGAFYCIVSLPIKNSDTFAQWLLENYSLENETIMVAPAGGFYATENLGNNQIRIAYVLEKEILKRAVRILREALNTYILNEHSKEYILKEI